MKDFSDRLLYLIEIVSKRKQKNFAKKVGIPEGTISRYVKKKVANPSVDHLVQICRETGYTMEWLSTDNGHGYRQHRRSATITGPALTPTDETQEGKPFMTGQCYNEKRHSFFLVLAGNEEPKPCMECDFITIFYCHFEPSRVKF